MKKHVAVIVFAICVMGLLSFSRVEAARDGSVAPGPSKASAIGTVDHPALKNDVMGQVIIGTARIIDPIECLSRYSLNHQWRQLGWRDQAHAVYRCRFWERLCVRLGPFFKCPPFHSD